MELRIVTHDADGTALHMHPFCNGPPHDVSVDCETTSNVKSPPAAGTSNVGMLTP
jgi:hypothetical protein